MSSVTLTLLCVCIVGNLFPVLAQPSWTKEMGYWTKLAVATAVGDVALFRKWNYGEIYNYTIQSPTVVAAK